MLGASHCSSDTTVDFELLIDNQKLQPELRAVSGAAEPTPTYDVASNARFTLRDISSGTSEYTGRQWSVDGVREDSHPAVKKMYLLFNGPHQIQLCLLDQEGEPHCTTKTVTITGGVDRPMADDTLADNLNQDDSDGDGGDTTDNLIDENPTAKAPDGDGYAPDFVQSSVQGDDRTATPPALAARDSDVDSRRRARIKDRAAASDPVRTDNPLAVPGPVAPSATKPVEDRARSTASTSRSKQPDTGDTPVQNAQPAARSVPPRSSPDPKPEPRPTAADKSETTVGEQDRSAGASTRPTSTRPTVQPSSATPSPAGRAPRDLQQSTAAPATAPPATSTPPRSDDPAPVATSPTQKSEAEDVTTQPDDRPTSRPKLVVSDNPPPPPPTAPAASTTTADLSRAATTGAQLRSFSTDCGTYSDGSAKVALKVSEDIELRGFSLNTDNCGKVRITLMGDGRNESVTQKLAGGPRAISLSHLGWRLTAGKTYFLTLTPLGDADLCGSDATPALANAGRCGGGDRPVAQVELDYDGRQVLFDFRFYY